MFESVDGCTIALVGFGHILLFDQMVAMRSCGCHRRECDARLTMVKWPRRRQRVLEDLIPDFGR
jgi:hypothetical protein